MAKIKLCVPQSSPRIMSHKSNKHWEKKPLKLSRLQKCARRKITGKKFIRKTFAFKASPRAAWTGRGGIEEGAAGGRGGTVCATLGQSQRNEAKRNTAIFVETAVDSGQKQVFKCQQQTQEKPAADRRSCVCVCVCELCLVVCCCKLWGVCASASAASAAR